MNRENAWSTTKQWLLELLIDLFVVDEKCFVIYEQPRINVCILDSILASRRKTLVTQNTTATMRMFKLVQPIYKIFLFQNPVG